MLTQFAGLEINVRTSIIHTSVCVEWCGLVLTACVRHNVTHAQTRNDNTHVREGIIDKCTATDQQVHIQ